MYKACKSVLFTNRFPDVKNKELKVAIFALVTKKCF